MQSFLSYSKHFLLIVFSIFSINSFSQNLGKGHYVYQSGIISISQTSQNITIQDLGGFNAMKLKDGILILKADMGGDYILGKNDLLGTGSNDFDFYVKFVIELNSTPSPVVLNGQIHLTNDKPEGVYLVDLNPYANTSNYGLSFNTVTITYGGLDQIVEGASLASFCRLTGMLDLNYALDVSGMSVSNLGASVVANNQKVMHFTWGPSTIEFPSYEIQILRLYNEEKSLADPLNSARDEQIIQVNSANPDWTKALTFEIEGYLENIKLSIGEGQGYYIWRVRPIGTYFDGGYANSLNYGSWNSMTLSSNSLNSFFVDASVVTAGLCPVFFFTDPDADHNYIYSRTFTEGKSNQSEQISYANGLLNMQQSQVYSPSTGKTLVSETMQDNVGRNALSTLPVPVPNGLNGYKSDFILSPTGTPYSVNDFDGTAYLREPKKINSGSQSAYSYYSDENDDEQVPTAEGYPYSRMFYENDGSNRVKETAGPGLAHSVGPLSTQNHDVKTYYATSSQGELDKMFGEEAPLAKNVFKTIQVDNNNTASVTYTNKEGQLIATALTFVESAGVTEILEPLESSPVSSYLTDDAIESNIKTNDGYVSTKRIALLEATSGTQVPLHVEYNLACIELDGMCGETSSIDCKYNLTVRILNSDDLSVVETYGPNPVLCNDNVAYVLLEHDFLLDPGTYIVEKRISREPNSIASVSTNLANAFLQLTEITNWIDRELEQVNCDEELMQFYNDFYYLASLFHHDQQQPIPLLPGIFAATTVIDFNCQDCSGHSFSFSEDFQEFYLDNSLDFNINYDLQGSGTPSSSNHAPEDLPKSVTINTPCCGTVRVSLLYQPPFKCPSAAELYAFRQDVDANGWDATHPQVNGNFEKRDINFNFLNDPTATEILPDFEGYAVSMLANCIGDHTDPLVVQSAKDKFYSHMNGWNREGMFNMMVFHMLTDVYTTVGLGSAQCQAPLPQGTQCGDPPIPPTVPITDLCAESATDQLQCTNYSCKDLSKCWSGIVQLLINQECQLDLDLDDLGTSGKISEKFDEQNDGNKEPHDDQADDNFDIDVPWPFGWILETLMSKQLRDKQDVPGSKMLPPRPTMLKVNFVKMFLECTGYQFADIIDKSNYPCYPITSCSEEFTSGSDFSAEDGFHSLDLDFDADPLGGEYDPDYWFGEFSNSNGAFPFQGDASNAFSDYNGWKSQPVFGTHPLDIGELTLSSEWSNIRNPIYAFKYYEYAYGSKNDLEITSCFRDPNWCYVDLGGGIIDKVPCCGSDGNGGALPCDFCNIGYISCGDLTKENWTSGQRYTFYNMLKSTHGLLEPGTPIPDYDLVAKDNCGRKEEAHYWYMNVPPIGETKKFLGYSIISEDEWTDPVLGYSSGPISSERLEFYGVDDLSSKVTHISMAEAGMAQKNREGIRKCESRRTDFETKLKEMLAERCYVIGGCKLSADDNVIPEEDINELVQAMVDQCVSQCNIRSYDCRDEYCRNIYTDPFVLAIGDEAREPPCSLSTVELDPLTEMLKILLDAPLGSGMTNRITRMTYGVAGCLESDPNCDYPSVSTGFIRYGGASSSLPTDYPYGEYTELLQAKTWDVEIGLPSKCGSDGNYTTVANDQGYILNPVTNNWELDQEDCNNLRTSLPRSDYESLNNNIFDPNNPILNPNPSAGTNGIQVNDPVKSPAITIQITLPH